MNETKRWNAYYTIKESPGYAIIGDIPAEDEATATAWAEKEVGTVLRQWDYDFKLLALRGVREVTK